MINIFEYMNYRDFLRDYYNEKKESQPWFSYRLFSQKAGFKSPNMLKLVTTGKRNLSKQSVFQFSKAMGFNKKEADYFENLVFFNQSRLLEEKNVYLKQLMKYRKRLQPEIIEQDAYTYYSKWYHPVIRELVTSVDFKKDYDKLGRMLIPSISGPQAQKSVRLLISLGFIKKHRDGTFYKTSAVLTTGRQIRSVAAANYHREMMKLASESIERFDSSKRNIESLTVSMSLESYEAIMEKTHDYLMELLKIARSDKKNEIVAQISTQIFPLCKNINQKRRSR